MPTVHAVTLETTTCWCGAPMALPDTVLRNARELGNDLYCPATGHKFRFGSEVDALRKKLEAERSRNTALTDQLRAAERQVSSAKGQLTKARKRAAAGVCPCCNRSFVQLARHMATKHPDYSPTREETTDA